jgi:pyridoxal phosphate enzyme (YggS family)
VREIGFGGQAGDLHTGKVALQETVKLAAKLPAAGGTPVILRDRTFLIQDREGPASFGESLDVDDELSVLEAGAQNAAHKVAALVPGRQTERGAIASQGKCFVGNGNSLLAALIEHRLPAGRDKVFDDFSNFAHGKTKPQASGFQEAAGRTLRYPGNRLVLREKLDLLESRIAAATARAGRRRSDITLVAVTKKFPAEVVRAAYELGLRDFGENYVQEFEQKQVGLAGLPDARFHLIGHLQANKAKKAAELFDSIQTLDSEKLVRRLDQEAKPVDVMIEVKLSNEEAKSGASQEEIGRLAEAIRATTHLRLLGLMTIPPWSVDAEASRPYFARLRELAEANRLTGLSMGMSNDFEAAIEEGATIVRIGTALFGPRPKPAESK